MPQLLHLLIVDRARHRAIVQPLDGRWLLPTIACGERVRAPLVAARWVRARGLNGFVVGQWAGRIAPGGSSIDWLIAIALEGDTVPNPFSWCPIDHLSPNRALIGYQGCVINKLEPHARFGVRGPFGTFSWIDAASAWLTSVTGTRCQPSACFRASSHEVVVAYVGLGTTLYFKGLAEDCASRAVAESEAARAAPGSFSRTLAQERRSDGSIFTLTTSCAGESLPQPLDNSIATRVASDIGRLQRRLHRDIALRSVLTPIDLDRTRVVMTSLLSRRGFPAMDARVDEAFEAVGDMETGWTPTDLDPANVRVSADSLQYFDLDARLAPPPFAIAIFAKRINERTRGDCIRLRERIRTAFETSWGQSAPWTATEIVSGIVELTMAWERVQRNVSRGELTGDVEAVEQRIAQRLCQSIR